MRGNRTQEAQLASAEEHVRDYERREASAATAEKAAFYHDMASVWRASAERLRHTVAKHDQPEDAVPPASRTP
jgi:hypothetical protein